MLAKDWKTGGPEKRGRFFFGPDVSEQDVFARMFLSIKEMNTNFQSVLALALQQDSELSQLLLNDPDVQISAELAAKFKALVQRVRRWDWQAAEFWVMMFIGDLVRSISLWPGAFWTNRPLFPFCPLVSGAKRCGSTKRGPPYGSWFLPGGWSRTRTP